MWDAGRVWGGGGGAGAGGQEGMLNTPGGLTVSESGPRCSGSRGFSSVICCSFIPAILDSNLQSPWQQAQNAHRHRQCGFHCYFVRPGFCCVLTLKKTNSQHWHRPLPASYEAIMALEFQWDEMKEVLLCAAIPQTHIVETCWVISLIERCTELK